MNKIVWLLLITFMLKIEAKEGDIALASMFQNEAPYLKEWIEYHRLIGVSHFYLWSNQSQDDYLQVLAPYIEEGVVELFEAPETIASIGAQMGAQAKYMNQALRLAEGNYEWLIMIDSDEFVCPMQKESLQAALEEYKDLAGISVQWICFGTSNIEKIPRDKLMIEVLTHRAPYNSKLNGPEKWIVKPERRQNQIDLSNKRYYEE